MSDAVREINGCAALGLTDQQRQAIATRESSIGLAAGAGCGKTLVLTERFLSYFDPDAAEGLSPDDVGRVVAITFTKRAAREMRDRIRRACTARLEKATGERDVAHWEGMLGRLVQARISTIDSFCEALLRAHAIDLGLDPTFRVLDEASAQAMLIGVVDEVLSELLTRRDDPLFKLLDAIELNTLRDTLIGLMQARSRAHFGQWAYKTADDLIAVWQQHVNAALPAALAVLAKSAELGRLIAILEANPCDDPKLGDNRKALIAELRNLLEDPSVQKWNDRRLTSLRELAKVKPCGAATKWSSSDEYTAFRDSAEALRGEIDDMLDVLRFDPQAARAAAELGVALLKVAVAIADEYAERKRRLAALDFDDLLNRAHRLLTHADHHALQKQIAGQLRYVLVDEFQDTDPQQVELVSALCAGDVAGGKLFFVGDYKQSIYGFRGAEPDVFRRLREQMPPPGQLSLTQNFRSEPGILRFVNTVFDGAMDAYEALVPSRSAGDAHPRVEFLWARGDQQQAGEGDDAEASRRREADWIARRLRGLIDGGQAVVADAAAGPGAKRAVRLGDIAILFRALSDVQYYEEALRRYGLDYYLVGGRAFYAQQEIFDLVNLLRAIDSPSDSVALVGALRSPLFSLSDEALFTLAEAGPDANTALARGAALENLAADQRQQVAFAAKTIADLRRLKDRLPIAELIAEAVARTAYDAALVAEFMGQRKLRNLEKLIGQAREFDRTGIFTLADFIAQLSTFVAQQPREELAATHAEDADVVRLMTVHQAKGLEFPVVVVADLARIKVQNGAKAVFSPTLGPLVNVTDEKKRKGEKNVVTGYRLWSLANADREMAELMRVFYVACTRAAEYLILSSPINDFESPGGDWLKLLASRFDLSSGVPVAADDGQGAGGASRVAVIEERPALAGKPSMPSRKSLKRIVEGARRSAGRAAAPPHFGRVPPESLSGRQYAVSRLRGTLHPAGAASLTFPLLPDPGGQMPLDPPGMGTLLLDVAARLPVAEESIAGLVERLAVRHDVFNPADVQHATKIISNLLASATAARFRDPTQMHREVEFVLNWPAAFQVDSTSVGPSTATSAGAVQIVGVIDRLCRDAAGNWHLLVFQTESLGGLLPSAAAEQYEMQMVLCAVAAEQVISSPVGSTTLHFLRSGDAVDVAVDRPARERCAAMVEQALRQCLALEAAEPCCP